MKEEKKLKTKNASTTKKSPTSKPALKESTTSKKTTEKKVESAKKSTTKKSTTSKKTTMKKTPVKKKVTTKKDAIPEIAEEKVIVKEETINPIKEEKMVELHYEINNPMSIIGIVLALVLAIILAIQFYMQMRNETYSERWEDKSYLVEHGLAELATCDTLTDVIKGEHSLVLVINYSQEAFELEKNLRDLVEVNDLKGNFHVYPLIDNCGPISDKNSQVGLSLNLTTGLEKTPAILYYQDGELMEIVTREDNQIINEADFQQFLDIYELNKE